MKLTKSQIKQIIKEELETVMREIEAEPANAEMESKYDEDAAEKELQDALAKPMHQ